ncbi:IPExxxVDY family protein [Flavobacterium sp. ZT3R18]|uniref:IPExxxVDY family protein n=1 Tax=Flavobacterium sp. ZT3R18 TaxID=2594429 RepID=UPI00117BAEAE|nr:IPExxxVDY family protein [Flavobacterium sp. ZT3R18]TRX38053.1 IPExxxVDY family protein [Flavobacterium sp. ZT3R18]
MAIHKLDLGEFDEIDYSLIAIYTSLDDYRLAYYINQKFNVSLSKSKKEIQITGKDGEVHFSRFHYYEKKKEISWDLIQNKNEVIQKQKKESLDLFSNMNMDVSSKVYMLPEFKKADYFLKIENGVADLNILKIQNTLNTIDNITTMYIVDTNKLKSKNNLIF